MTNVNNAVTVTSTAQDSKVAILNLMISCMSADRQIDLSKIGIKVEELPEATRKMITEKIFPKDFLRTYTRFREQAVLVLGKDGSVMTDMGAVTSMNSATVKVEELEDLKTQWNEQLDKDGPGYHEMCQAHLLSIAQAALDSGADPILVNKLTEYLFKCQPSWEQVKAALRFGYVVTIVSLDEGDFDPQLFKAQRESVVALRTGVLGALVQHICKEANAILVTIKAGDRVGTHGEIKINPRTIRRAQEMVSKLESLAFIHPMIKPVHDVITAEMDKLPSQGVMSASEFANFEQCLEALRYQDLVWERLQNNQPLLHVTPVTQAAQPQQALVLATVSAPVTAPAVTVATAPVASATVSVAVTVASAAVTSQPEDEEQEETAPAELLQAPELEQFQSGMLFF